jgi:OOP family OmpA-OmpF porin
MLKRIVVSSIAVATLLAGPAGAQTRAPDSGFYGGLGVGHSDSNLGSAIDSTDTAWKAFGGYQFNRYIAVEGGYIDLGKTATPGASFDSKALQASAVGSLPVTPQFAFTGKLGVAQVKTDVNGGTDHNFDPTYGLGLRYDINRQIGIRGEWERFRVSGNPLAGKSDTDVFSVNAVYRFY